MANVANPRKVFQFKIDIAGIGNFEAQKVTLPTIKTERVAHGDTNHDVKTPGRVEVGELTIEKIKPTVESGISTWERLKLAQNTTTGGGQLPSALKQIVTVREMDSTGLATIATHIYDGCWLSEGSQNDLDRMSSDNIMETLVFSVDRKL